MSVKVNKTVKVTHNASQWQLFTSALPAAQVNKAAKKMNRIVEQAIADNPDDWRAAGRQAQNAFWVDDDIGNAGGADSEGSYVLESILCQVYVTDDEISRWGW